MENTFKVEGMSCGHCVMAVKKELNKLNLKQYNVEIGKVVIDTDNNITSEKVISAIESAGYKVIHE